MDRHNIDDAIKKVTILYDQCKETLELLNKVQNDELYVSIIIPFGDDGIKITNWIFENNIVAKWQSFDVCITDTVIRLSITGFNFRNKEDAMAFKLRWL